VFRSLRSRLFITYVIVSGSALLLVTISLVLFLIRNPVVEGLEYRLLNFWLDRYANQEAARLLETPPVRQAGVLERMDQVSRARVILLDPDGEILADSRTDDPSLPVTVLERIMAGSAISQGRYFLPGSGQWLYVSKSLQAGNRLVLSSPRPALRSLGLFSDELLIPVLQAGAAAIVLSVILAWLMARWVAAPLGRTAQAARAVAAGDYNQQLELKGPVEAESMAVAFNEMVGRVQASRQAQRDFVANVSHELKTPLTSIQGFAQAIMDGTADDTQSVQHAARVIYDESDRLRRLVEDLLDLARLDAGQVRFDRQPVELASLVGAVAERLGVRAAERSVRVANLLTDFPLIIGDGDRLAQVFTNLVDNAIKHTPEGGEVRLHGEHSHGWITIHVDDNGVGIPPDELSRIFERFYQLDKARAGGSGRGVGLGLAISREIVQAHGGRLIAQSEQGQGSRFTVQLPVVQPDDQTLIRNSTP
jgi:two-component system OmpR family sensor kinase